ncbi:MAG: hypothetical protein G3W66_21115 [Xanthomonas perforans]|nr:hypothetical protein [Xanthomonas perforans]
MTLKRTIYTLAFVALGVILGKFCQYGAVALLQPRMGFTTASAVGLAPFVMALIVLKSRYPRYFAFRSGR